jgi:hypothetical protein
MASNTLSKLEQQLRRSMPLRAIVEIQGGELKVYPIAESDLDEQRIIDALRFVREDLGR